MRRALTGSVAVIALIAGSSGCRRDLPPQSVSLETVASIRRLSPSQLKKGHPVKLPAYVVYWEPRSRILIVGDGTASILVDHQDPRQELARGTALTILGKTDYDNFVPVIVKARVQVRPGLRQPEPKSVNAASVLAGNYEHQYVSFKARLDSFRSFFFDKTRVVLSLEGRPVNGVIMRDVVGLSSPLVGREVTVRAVPVARRNPSGGIYDVDLLLTSGSDIQPVEPISRNTTPAVKANAELPALTSIPAIKALDAAAAAQRYPVRLRAVVTVFKPSQVLLILNDGKEGLYVFPMKEVVSDLPAGELIELVGYTDPGGFAPSVIPTSIKRLGQAPYPRPIALTADSQLSTALDNKWVEVTGTLRSVRLNARGLPILRIALGRSLFDAELLESEKVSNIQSMVDATVRIQGVWSPLFGPQRQLLGFKLFVPAKRFITQLGSTIPVPNLRPISQLLGFAAGSKDPNRIRVAGVVTASRATGEVWIEDRTGGAEIEIANREDAPPTLGQSLEVTGLLHPAVTRSVLQEAKVQTSSPLPPVKPAPVAVEYCASGDLDARLIQVEGYLTAVSDEIGDIALTARSGRTEFRALLEAPSADVLPSTVREGSLLRFVGVCKVRWNAEFSPPVAIGMDLILRDPGDIRVVTAASWWTREHTLLVLGGVTLITLASIALLLFLRRKLRSQELMLKAQGQREVELQLELEQARRLESIGRLAGGVAHDFNNLLTVISGYAELLQRRLPNDEKTHTQLGQIVKASAKAASLTQQLLAYSRKQTLQPKVLDLNDEIREAVSILERLIDESIHLDLRLKESISCIRVDPSQLHQILLNLLTNARDAMPDGGKLTIETRESYVDAENAKLAQINPGLYVRMIFTDTGIGMDENTKAHLFEPFFSTKGLGKGTGLGLATVYGIVKQSGGHIWVYSEPGMGSTFKIQFPATNERTSRSTPTAESSKPLDQPVILLVEDREDVRELTAGILQESGYTVLEASSGEEALEISGNNGNIDLLLVDAILPGINGRQVAETLSARIPALKVLYMSGYSENVVVSRGQLKAGIRLLEKPFTREELLQYIRETLRSTNHN